MEHVGRKNTFFRLKICHIFEVGFLRMEQGCKRN